MNESANQSESFSHENLCVDLVSAESCESNVGRYACSWNKKLLAGKSTLRSMLRKQHCVFVAVVKGRMFVLFRSSRLKCFGFFKTYSNPSNFQPTSYPFCSGLEHLAHQPATQWGLLLHEIRKFTDALSSQTTRKHLINNIYKNQSYLNEKITWRKVKMQSATWCQMTSYRVGN